MRCTVTPLPERLRPALRAPFVVSVMVLVPRRPANIWLVLLFPRWWRGAGGSAAVLHWTPRSWGPPGAPASPPPPPAGAWGGRRPLGGGGPRAPPPPPPAPAGGGAPKAPPPPKAGGRGGTPGG